MSEEMKDYTGLRAEAKINDVILINNTEDLQMYGVKMEFMHIIDKKNGYLIGNYYDKKIDNSIVKSSISSGSIDEKSNYMICRRDVKNENDIIDCDLLKGISISKKISRWK